jgi:cytochrome d ubiquinol oxidase subunit I
MYFAVFGTGVMYMLKLVSKGPSAYVPPELESDGLHGTPLNQRPARPLSAAPDDVDPPIDTSAGA